MLPDTHVLKKVPAGFDFSRHLTNAIQRELADWTSWRWVSDFGGKDSDDKVSPLRHPGLKKFLKNKENLHCPSHRRVKLTLTGNTFYGRNGIVYPCTAGTVMLFGEKDSSQWKSSSFQRKKQTASLWLHLRTHVDTLTYDIHSSIPGMRLPTKVMTGELVVQLDQAWNQCDAEPDHPLNWLYLKILLTHCFLEILGTATSERSIDHHEQIVKTVQEYIQKNVGEDLRLQTLARIAGYSPSFFHHLFFRCTGITPQEYISRIRLTKAEELLKQNWTVEAVAEAVGIESVTYFRRFFKQRMRISPARWRKLTLAEEEKNLHTPTSETKSV